MLYFYIYIGSLFSSQSKYIVDPLLRASMPDAKPVDSPIAPKVWLSLHDGQPLEDATLSIEVLWEPHSMSPSFVQIFPLLSTKFVSSCTSPSLFTDRLLTDLALSPSLYLSDTTFSSHQLPHLI